MKVRELLTNTYKSSPLLPAEIDSILGITLHKSKEYLYKKSDKNLTISAIKKFKKLIIKRQTGWPMAYLRGWQEFYALKFLVNKNTLIPRSDSELIIDTSLEFLKNSKNLNILDIGTGSGCLIIALAKNKANNNYTACDISKSALQKRTKEDESYPFTTVNRIPLPESVNPCNEYGKKGIYTSEVYRLNFGGNIIDLTDLEQLIELSQTKAIGFALDYARRYMDSKNTIKEIITQVKHDIGKEGLDILSDRISGNFAWFRDIELAFVLNRLRSVQMIQKETLKTE